MRFSPATLLPIVALSVMAPAASADSLVDTTPGPMTFTVRWPGGSHVRAGGPALSQFEPPGSCPAKGEGPETRKQELHELMGALV